MGGDHFTLCHLEGDGIDSLYVILTAGEGGGVASHLESGGGIASLYVI